jgi:TldD protein
MPLRDFMAERVSAPDQLPAEADLLVRARELAEGLVALRKAPVGESYTGPVLLEGQAACELVAQTMVPLFLSRRRPESENAQMMGPMPSMETPLLTRVGSRVLPEGFSVSDTPSLSREAGREVPGAYMVDDEGVPAQDVTLVEGGKLITLLTGRTPQKGFLTSNGHARGGAAQAGVFQVRSSSALPADQLKAKYLERLNQAGRPFGYIIRTLANPMIVPSLEGEGGMQRMMMMMGSPDARQAGPWVIEAVKVMPDGREELVRGLRLGSISHTALRDIIEASAERTLYTYRPAPSPAMMPFMMSAGGTSTGDVTVSLLAPNLVFDELELEKGVDPHQRPPIVPSPLR